jgi:predicted RNase H-like nuclease (RuvC/YqgF family)
VSDCGTCPAFGYDCEYVAKVEAQAAEIEELRAQLKTVLDREAETHRRHDAKVEALEAENERLKNILRDCDPESMSWLDARDAALGETE